MQDVRRQFGRWVIRTTGGFGGTRTAMAGGPDPDRTAIIVWGILFVLLILGSFVLAYFLHLLFLQTLLAALWGAFIGLSILFFLHQKIVITAIGAFLGAGVTDLTGISQIVEKLSVMIHSVVGTINAEVAGEVVIYDLPGWVFLACLAIPCLLAYR